MKDIMKKLAELEATAPKVTKKKMLNEDSTTPPMNVSDKPASLKDIFETMAVKQPIPVVGKEGDMQQTGAGFLNVTDTSPAAQALSNALGDLAQQKKVQIVVPTQGQQSTQPNKAGATGQPQQGQMQMREKDEGKPGKNFAKIAKSAGKRYGSKEAGERVAGAVRAKLAKQGKLEEVDMGQAEQGMRKSTTHKGGYQVVNKAGKVISKHKNQRDAMQAALKHDDYKVKPIKEEQLDELDPKTISSYLSKSQPARNKAKDAEDRALYAMNGPEAKQAIQTRQKRDYGIATAQGKLGGQGVPLTPAQSASLRKVHKDQGYAPSLGQPGSPEYRQKAKVPMKWDDPIAESKLNEKFASQQQAKLMYAAADDKDVAKKTGVSQKVAKEFIKKSHGQKVSKLPKKVKEGDIPSTHGQDTMGAGLGAGRSRTTLEGKKPDFLDLDKDGNKKESMKKAAADKKKQKVKESMNHRISAARLEGKSHGLRGHAHSGKRYEDIEEMRAYHEGFKEGMDELYEMGMYETAPAATVPGMADQEMEEGKLKNLGMAAALGATALAGGAMAKKAYDYHKTDPAMGMSQSGLDQMTGKDYSGRNRVATSLQAAQSESAFDEGNAFTAALAKTPKGGKFSVGGKTFTDTSSLEEYAFESLDKQLNALLTESMEEVDALAEWADSIINEKLELGESETLKIKNIKLEAPRFKMWDSNKGPIPFSATLEQNGKPVGQVEIMVDADASPDAWNQEDVNINSIKVTSNGKDIDPNTIDIPYFQIKSQLLDVIGDPYEWSQDNGPPRRNDYLYDLDESDVVPFKKKQDEEVTEGLSVSVSKGNQNSPDSVTITAQDAEADQLLQLVKHAGLGLFGDDHDHAPSSAMSIQPAHGAPDEVGAGGVDVEVVDGNDGIMGLMQKLSGIQSAGADDYEDEEGEEQLHGNHSEVGKKDCGCDDDCDCEEKTDEAMCNECGMMEGMHESSCSMNEEQTPNQLEAGVAEDNAPDSGAAETTADENAEAEEDKALALKSVNESFADILARLEKLAEGSGDEPKHAEHDKKDDKDFDDAEKEEDVKESEELNEWANNAGKKGTDAAFEADIDFMTKVIAGGLNKPKSTGQTTVPVIAGQESRMHDHQGTVSDSIDDWTKLAGIK